MRDRDRAAVRGLVSTIIPVYNRSELLREAVDSVLAQTYPNIEIIVVDDGSTDGTADACDEMANRHEVVRVVHLAHQGRPGLAREAGRLVARGEYLQYLDSDDLLLPAKFERMITALEAHPECDIAYCYTRRYRRGERPRNIPAEMTGVTFQSILPDFLARRFWYTSTPIYRTALCDRGGPWSDLRCWEDTEYDVRLATLNPRLCHCKEFLTDYRDHDTGRVSGTSAYANPRQVGEMSRAASQIYQHARKFGLTMADENLRFFVDDIRALQDRCGRMALAESFERCSEILRDALGAVPEPLTIRAAIEPQSSLVRCAPGETETLQVRVRNDSPITFRAGDFTFELSSHVLAVNGKTLPIDSPTTVFDQPLRPGEERVVPLPVRAPASTGLYYLEIDLLWGAITWLSARGNPTALARLFVAPDAGDTKWRLEVRGEGNSATLLSPPGDAAAFQIAIHEAPSGVAWDIQLNRVGLSVRGGERYALSLRARSSNSMRVGIGFAMAHAPWQGLGLYQTVDVTTDWNVVNVEFVATQDDERARLHFDLGGNVGTLEAADVQLAAIQPESAHDSPLFSPQGRLQMDIGVQPLSEAWGTDRGLPPHRYYVERFLESHRQDIRGHCLEFEDPTYTRRFGGEAVTTLDILHRDHSNPRATLVADLTRPNDLATGQFDCIICTHVLQMILDVDKAISELHRILKNGGVLLLAEPHVSMSSETCRELWRFTPNGMHALLSRAFGENHVSVHPFGNALVTAGDLRGLVRGEFSDSELGYVDPRFAVEVCARAVKTS